MSIENSTWLRTSPWFTQYDEGQSHSIDPEFDHTLELFRATVDRAPFAPLIEYFGFVTTAGALDVQSDAFAAALVDSGIEPGDRVALFLQNVPQYEVALLGIWKASAIAVNVNPMNKARELREILQDSGSRAIVYHRSLHGVVAEVIGETDVATTITVDIPDESVGAEVVRERGDGPSYTAHDMSALITSFAGIAAPTHVSGPDDTAVLTYTSGTTGPAKGAMISHRNITYNVQALRNWIGLSARDTILGVSPLFHVTGLVGQIGLSLLSGAPLILMHRFDPEKAVDIISTRKATFAVGSITIFIAMMNAKNATRESLRSLEKIYSGGAPIPPALVERFESRFGHYIHNIYGLTETTSPTHCVPLHGRAPVDKETGATSVGVPIYGTEAQILDEAGRQLPPGSVGELVIRGPQVVSGYWNNPEQSAATFVDGALRTGDIAYMDAEGWFYIVDRKKDQINAGGFKIWPREVEDVLYEHPAVREAAVIGVPDEYRGETVKAFVSLQPGATAAPDELIEFVRDRMAAYKYPRQVEILPELAKTASGKILRRNLRETTPDSGPSGLG
ncbi:long-chain-fatty-acid--CoA ligase [Rhodococcus sp. 24CO]|uniref:long-chain-fatty-acid--CoA ligase n=1 Tax=Rhodococcus sp. 24CO TaxID=3117460 RepID=UPI003D32B092